MSTNPFTEELPAGSSAELTHGSEEEGGPPGFHPGLLASPDTSGTDGASAAATGDGGLGSGESPELERPRRGAPPESRRLLAGATSSSYPTEPPPSALGGPPDLRVNLTSNPTFGLASSAGSGLMDSDLTVPGQPGGDELTIPTPQPLEVQSPTPVATVDTSAEHGLMGLHYPTESQLDPTLDFDLTTPRVDRMKPGELLHYLGSYGVGTDGLTSVSQASWTGLQWYQIMSPDLEPARLKELFDGMSIGSGPSAFALRLRLLADIKECKAWAPRSGAGRAYAFCQDGCSQGSSQLRGCKPPIPEPSNQGNIELIPVSRPRSS
jgi:hypothetical protein